MISRLRNRVPRGSQKNILPVSRHPLGSGGTNVRLVVICLLSAFLILLSIHKGVKSFRRTKVEASKCLPETSLRCQSEQLDDTLSHLRNYSMLDTSSAGRSKSEEAYATVIYYPVGTKLHYDIYMYACAAASLGLALKQIDPERPRVALVTGLMEDARRILTDGDIWELVDVPQWPEGTLENDTALVYERKAALWDLTSYKRVYFFDSDMFIVPDKSGQRLKRLETMWQLKALGEWHPYIRDIGPLQFREGYPYYRCVNGGYILLEPSSEVSARYRDILQDPPHAQFTPCVGRDQKLLSYLFPQFVAMSRDLWRVFKYEGEECHIVLGDEPAIDVIHLFLHHFKHWRRNQPFWGGDCTSCILNGKTCKYPNMFTEACHKKIIELWWERIMQLPSSTANMCMHHLGANLNNVDEACYNK